MSKKILSRAQAFSSLQWWSGFDRADLNGKANTKAQTKEEAVCWPFYTA